MLQSQYYNHKLTKNQIEKILTNYNIKYNTMKNEIDAKFNNMIKLFLNDIRAFLENIEEITNERKKIKEAENTQMEIAILKSRLEEKSLNENKMKNEIDNLTKENLSLKTKIKVQANISSSKSKAKNKNINELTSTNSSILKSESRPVKSRYLKFRKDGGILNKTKNKNNKSFIKTEGNKNYNRKNNHLSMSVEKRTIKDIENLKYASAKDKGIHSNNNTEKRTVNNYKNINLDNKKIKNKNKKNYSINKTPENKAMTVNTTGNISNSNINSKKNKTIDNDKKHSISEIPPFEQSIDDDDSLVTVDDVIEEELKELEIDEEKIILLIEQIKNLNKEVEES